MKPTPQILTRVTLAGILFVFVVLVARNTSPQMETDPLDHAIFLSDDDPTNTGHEDIENYAPKITQDETSFTVSDVVQSYVLKHTRLRITRKSKSYVAGQFQIHRSPNNVAKFGFSSHRTSAGTRIYFALHPSSTPSAKKLYKFRGFLIKSNGPNTRLVVYPNVEGRASIAITFTPGKKLFSHHEKLYKMFLKDLVVGSFIEHDIKLGAAGFVGDANLPVQAITFYANSFAMQSKKVGSLKQWEIDEEEVSRANELVEATKKLGRSPVSMEEMEGSSTSRRRLVICKICPVCCRIFSKDKCDMTSGCGNPCIGRCGKDCSCWKWVCGDCGCHCNCRDHDVYCSCIGYFHFECLNVVKYSDCTRKCDRSLDRHIRKGPLQSGRRYSIISVHSRKAMEIRDGNTNKGSKVVQWSYHKFPNQIWVFDPNALRGRGYYHVQNYQSRLYWDIAGNGKHNGAELIQWSRHNGANQKFLFQHLGGDVYRIRPQSVGKYLDLEGFSTANNAKIHAWSWHGGNNQRWIIKPVDVCNLGRNVARNRPTGQVSKGWNGDSGRAVDGNHNGNYWGNSCTHTLDNQRSWWYVNIGNQKPVCSVKIYNRKDCCGERLQHFTVFVTNRKPAGDGFRAQPNEVCATVGAGRFDVKQINCGRPLHGKYVGVQLMHKNYLTICEFEVFVHA